MRFRAFTLVFILLSTAALSMLASALPEEDQNFKNKHIGVDFPVGWDDFEADSKYDLRVIYPAMIDGESEPMAGNGPFPFTIFFGDTDEEVSDYMILTSEIVKRGTIVIVTNGFDSDDTQEIEQSMAMLESIVNFMNSTNSSNSIIGGAFGNVDLNHWGVSGHGTGAAVAYSVYPFWNESQLSNEFQPPRSLFGLGLDFDGWSSSDAWESIRPVGWQIEPASPGTGLFLTGTVDEIAKGQDNLPIITATEDLAWQWMHILGADHYQFQDEIDDGFLFGDDTGDGDATMSQQEQIEYALEHVLPYLDLTLRGVHEDFRGAFNREQSPTTASDSESYIEENMFKAEMLLITNQTKFPSDVNQFGRFDTFSILSNWTLRNGDDHSEIDTNWQTNVECGFNEQVSTNGVIHSNGTAQCDYDVEELAPGTHIAFMTIMVEGAPSTIEHEFSRTDSPISFMSPLPNVEVPERGVGHIDASAIGIDPDGQEVFIVEATLSGGQISNFSVELDSDYRGMSVTHTVTGEYIIGAEVEVLLRADGNGVIDEAMTTLEILVIPYNDPVVKTDNVAMQTLIEDGSSIEVNLSEYAYDPEGEPLLASINEQVSGIAGPVEFSYFSGILTLTPVPDANGATVLHVRVTDGATGAVDLDIPVQVTPVDDPMSINSSMWNISMVEDETINLNLSDFASDIDGDSLSWTVESEDSGATSVIISGSQIIITPSPDYFGVLDNEWLNVTDGTSVYSQKLIINVESVPDLPILTLMNVNIIDDTAATLAWSLYDSDGVEEHGLEISLDGIVQEQINPSCTTSSNSQECVAMLEVPIIRNETVSIRVAVNDSAFVSDIVAYTVIDFNATEPIQEDDSEVDDSTEVSTTLVVAGSLGFIIMILVLVIILRTMNSEPVDTAVIDIRDESISVVEEELEVDISPSGLLARINKDK